ncbi:hypothetical protein EK904_006713 [Melospiza melodia maxima]|nr:hypothetical protein EK904_006713 [Melospiza melodia maxima]
MDQGCFPNMMQNDHMVLQITEITAFYLGITNYTSKAGKTEQAREKLVKCKISFAQGQSDPDFEYVFPGIQIITEGKSPHRHEDTKVLQSTATGLAIDASL